VYHIKQLQTDIDCVELSKFLLKKEPEIIKKYPPTGYNGIPTDGNTGLGENSTTSRFYHYNVLNWEGTDLLKKYIKLGYEEYTGLKDTEIYVKCWVNVMRKGDQIKPHKHSDIDYKENDYLCGHFNAQVDGTTSTFYKLNDHVEEMKNISGNITFFPSYVSHWTNLYNGNSQRITCAFDIKSKEFFEFDTYLDARSKWVKLE
tara:strand:+ start:71 stop:676 length:606 start_codon:yes stop_codon:yes gene_type:complete